MLTLIDRPFLRGITCTALAWLLLSGFTSLGAQRELIRDPHFESGFYLLEPKPGQRVSYGQLPGVAATQPVWDLAQWSSRFPLTTNDRALSGQSVISSNAAKRVLIGKPGTANADLTLAVNGGVEYRQPRKSSAEPWVHLLVQQDLKDPPTLASLKSCNFRMEARLIHSRLANTNGYNPGLHAAQFFVYLTIANQNPKAAGYQECFWFGVPVYDNREPVVPAYEAQDFGETKLFIYTPSSDTFAPASTHSGEWVTFTKDLLPLIAKGLEHARTKGFIKGSSNLADYRPLGVFIGWEVPGVFDVEIQMRNLSLKATAAP